MTDAWSEQRNHTSSCRCMEIDVSQQTEPTTPDELDEIFEQHLEVKGWPQDWQIAKARLRAYIENRERLARLDEQENTITTKYKPGNDGYGQVYFIVNGDELIPQDHRIAQLKTPKYLEENI